jgi:SAM-dependent methyltransferase
VRAVLTAGAALVMRAAPVMRAALVAGVTLTVVVTACGAGSLHAQDLPRHGDELYEPRFRQPGKDVMWLPTRAALVTRMLQAANTTRDDIVYDLGSGDGRIPIAAARDFAARAVGIEYDRDLAALARRNAARAGVADRVTIVEGDLFKEDWSRASVVTLYLLPDLNQQLRPQLLRMEPGTRVVSHRCWDMGEWEPDATLREGGSDAYLWVVPTAVAGRWALRDDDGYTDGVVDLAQRFQRLGGTLTIRGASQPLLGAWVRGEHLGFAFVHPDGGVRSVRLRVDGDAMHGTLAFAGTVTKATARRR